MNFAEWITKKYTSWAGKQEKNADTVENFANTIGVSQQLMSFWLNGKRQPGGRTIPLLAQKFGQEVYEVLGIPVNANEEVPWDQLPGPFRERLEAATAEVNARYQREGISPEIDTDGQRALEIAREVFDRFGINITEVEEQES